MKYLSLLIALLLIPLSVARADGDNGNGKGNGNGKNDDHPVVFVLLDATFLPCDLRAPRMESKVEARYLDDMHELSFDVYGDLGFATITTINLWNGRKRSYDVIANGSFSIPFREKRGDYLIFIYPEDGSVYSGQLTLM